MREQFGTATVGGVLLPQLESERCRARLEELLDVLRQERGWTRDRLGQALGRDPTKLIPDKAFPSLDLLVSVAGQIGWSVGSLAEMLVAGEPSIEQTDEETGLDLDGLIDRSAAAYRCADAFGTIRLANLAYLRAESAVDKGLALTRVIGGYELLGHFPRALAVACHAATLQSIPDGLRFCIASNLAYLHSVLSNHTQALALTSQILREGPASDFGDWNDTFTHAFTLFIHGDTHRRMLGLSGRADASHAHEAEHALGACIPLFNDLARQRASRNENRAMARIALGGLLEARVAAGREDPDEVLRRLDGRMNGMADVNAWAADDRLRSYGWWCVFACNMALRHQTGPDQQRSLAIFSNKAGEIAERTADWAIRERVFTIEFLRRQQLSNDAGNRDEWVMDREDVRILAGTAARFPRFRDLGLRIYRSATIVD